MRSSVRSKRGFSKNDGEYQCPDCIYRFETKQDLKMHSWNHYQDNEFSRRGKKTS